MEVTFLKAEQFEADTALEVIKRCGSKTGASDLAILLGADTRGNWIDNAGKPQTTCDFWLAEPIFPSNHGYYNIIDATGKWNSRQMGARNVGARPALPPSAVLTSIQKHEAKIVREINGVPIVEYGEYPQTVASQKLSENLERAFRERTLKTTGKKYTFDDIEPGDDYRPGFANVPLHAHEPFKEMVCPEYEFRGKRYIRVKAKNKDQNVWVEVQPIEWLADPTGWLVAKQVLFSGVQIDTANNRSDYLHGNFDKTAMHRYLNNHFSKSLGGIDWVGRFGTAQAEGTVLEKAVHRSAEPTGHGRH